MKNSKRIKDYSVLQKIGVFLLALGALIVLAKTFNILPDSQFLKHELASYLGLAGIILISGPTIIKRLRRNTSKTTILLALAILVAIGATAQDYSSQVAAFKRSFDEKSVESLKSHVSSALKFDPIPAANTPAILTNIVSNLPKLNSMSILESSVGKAKLRYDFVGLGIRESYVYFDTEGKFTRIELVENFIQQEMEAQKRMKESVQLPNPGVLGEKYKPAQVEFKANDGLLVTGNLYEVDRIKPVILLCHQAGFNRLEYADIAPKLNDLGYNCLALDLRSGGNFADKPNETAERAKRNSIKNEMIDAQEDIKAAIDYVNQKYRSKVILWGSSYSASLALIEGISNNKVNAIIAFSPGNYFGADVPTLTTAFARAEKPFLVTSSKEEASGLKTLIGNLKMTNNQSQFIPEADGFHGTCALWIGQSGAEEYWSAVSEFLKAVND